MRRLGCAALVLLTPTLAAAQIAERVEATDDGVVRFGYALRPGVEICAQGVRMADRHLQWRGIGDDRGGRDCRTDVAVIEVRVRDGSVRDVELVRGWADRSDRADDLGVVEARVASRYLLSLARSGARAQAASDAVFPAVIADVEEVWRELLDLAEDRGVPAGVRKSALFWLGQEAANAVTVELRDVAMDRAEDQDIRDAAVFALSQRSADEAVPTLIEVATTAEEAETRRKAMFWLAQQEDARVTDFFEQVLLGRVR